jgi:conjugative transposon TraN protein
MKYAMKIITAMMCCWITTVSVVKAQTEENPVPADTLTATPDTAYGSITPYEILVTYDKTTHVIFPAAIRYVDLGSEYITAAKAEDAENVLRVKAAVKNFSESTNFSVITEDGKFYNFNVWYSEFPAVLTLDFISGKGLTQKPGETAGEKLALFKELDGEQASIPTLVMQTLYKQNKRIIRHIGSQSFGIQLLLKSIYTFEGKLYFNLQFKNDTNIPFSIDFITFKVVDKKIAKRTVMQERIIHPLREYLDLQQIEGMSTARNIYLLEQMTIPDDKLLVIEAFEKNGGRHQILQVENEDLVRALAVKNMHLNFK